MAEPAAGAAHDNQPTDASDHRFSQQRERLGQHRGLIRVHRRQVDQDIGAVKRCQMLVRCDLVGSQDANRGPSQLQ